MVNQIINAIKANKFYAQLHIKRLMVRKGLVSRLLQAYKLQNKHVEYKNVINLSWQVQWMPGGIITSNCDMAAQVVKE